MRSKRDSSQGFRLDGWDFFAVFLLIGALIMGQLAISPIAGRVLVIIVFLVALYVWFSDKLEDHFWPWYSARFHRHTGNRR